MIGGGLAAFVRPLLLGIRPVLAPRRCGVHGGQTDIKRLLAYSSVEHMGLLVLGLGLGGVGAYGTVLHVLNNGLAKGLISWRSGNIVLATGTSSRADDPRHAPARPVPGVLLLVGLFAVTGSPPFGLFVSEFTILGAASARDTHGCGAVHAGAPRGHLRRHGASDPGGAVRGARRMPRDGPREGGGLVWSDRWSWPWCVLLLGLYLPPTLRDALARAAALLGGDAYRERHWTTWTLRNRRAVPMAAVPRETRGTVPRDGASTRWRGGWRLIAFFGMPETAGQTLPARGAGGR